MISLNDNEYEMAYSLRCLLMFIYQYCYSNEVVTCSQRIRLDYSNDEQQLTKRYYVQRL